MAEQVILTVDEEGRLEYEVKGVKGSGCKALTAELDKAMGGKATAKPTKEMYEQPKKEQQHRST
jgi:hypothetical protein